MVAVSFMSEEVGDTVLEYSAYAARELEVGGAPEKTTDHLNAENFIDSHTFFPSPPRA